jgi:hypothetical protein
MVVAKVLYLSRQASMDISVTVSLLCTRVKGPTVRDLEKLLHLLGYLKRTKGQTLVLRPRDVFHVEAYMLILLCTQTVNLTRGL